ncbi:MAG: RHS repeat domain-containing protein [Polyangiaceae bacterium]
MMGTVDNQNPGLGNSCTVAPDGTFYLIDPAGLVTRLAPDGTYWSVVGQANFQSGVTPSLNDGMFAKFQTGSPIQIGVAPDGSLIYYDNRWGRLRAVHTNGIVTSLAGTGGSIGFTATPTPALATQALVSWPFAAMPDGTIIAVSGDFSGMVKIQPPIHGTQTSGYDVASADGQSVYKFDGAGKHVNTRDAITGVTLAAFGYDGSGHLASVTDASGNKTTIERDGAGNPSAIIGPLGQSTTLAVDSNGFLASVTDPAGNQYKYSYDANGMLEATTTPQQGNYKYGYDSHGRLLTDVDPVDGGSTLSSTVTRTDLVVSRTTAGGVTSSFEVNHLSSGDIKSVVTGGNGLQTTTVQGASGVDTTTSPDGTSTTVTLAADPRFGMQAPVASTTTTTPAGLSRTEARTRSVALSDVTDLLSVQSATNTRTLNGNSWTSTFNAAASTWTTTSPAGRTTTRTLDTAGRTLSVSIPNVPPFTFAYDASGHLESTTQGTRSWHQTFDSYGFLASRTDPLGHVLSFVNDAIGRPTQATLADNRTVLTTFDGDSNVTAVTLPDGAVHSLTYSPVDLLASYDPPALGSSQVSTSYGYNIDRDPTSVSGPGGTSISYAYDTAGRLHSTTIPQGSVTRTYSSTTGHLATLVAPGGEGIGFSYDGFLQTGMTWSGPVAGSITFGFDNTFRVTSQTVGGTSLSFSYDADGLLTGAGSLTIARDPHNGQLTGTTLAAVTDSYTYDANGLPATYTASAAGTSLYAESFVHDASGHITQKTETIGATTHVWGYTYDLNGQLTDVTLDGSTASHYAYDKDDNRTTFTSATGTVNPTYDAQDRLLTYGSVTYNYTANGEVLSKTDSTDTTGYTYDLLGNLLTVTPPGAASTGYVVDGHSRRVGRQSGSTVVAGFLYQDDLNVVAQLDGSGNVVSRFVFGSKPNVPDYFSNASGTFRILSDHLGSPRLVVNASTGAVAEEIDYDEFGNVTNDTAPGTIPFGFAGGLYDASTGIVRFGGRDYDPRTGRWMTKDPTGLGGGWNLYRYCHNDPVNYVDRSGKNPIIIIVAVGVLAGTAIYDWYNSDRTTNDMRKFADDHYPNGYDNNAMRHCMASCILTQTNATGALGVAAGGTIRELWQEGSGVQSPSDTLDDINNNICGIWNGLDQPPGSPQSPQDYCQQACEGSLQSGQLQ